MLRPRHASRDPDIRWRRQESDLAALARQQTPCSCTPAAPSAPGGRLVYATCSSEPEENEQVRRVFEERREFRRVDARTVHPALDASLVDAVGRLRTSPVTHGLEAFFGVVFERTE